MIETNKQRNARTVEKQEHAQGVNGGLNAMAVATPLPVQVDWVKTVLFDRGYLARIRGEAIKVYLAIIEACQGLPDRSVTISLSQLMKRTELSCPTIIDSLAQLEELGLVVSTTHQRGRVKTYYVPGPVPNATG